MSKSIIYAVNSNSQILGVNQNVNFGNVVRRYGNNLSLAGDRIIENGSGYYEYTASFDLVGNEAGDIVISFYKDGVLIPGAYIILTTAIGDNYTASISFVTKETCCKESVITAEVSGAAVEIVNSSIVGEKL